MAAVAVACPPWLAAVAWLLFAALGQILVGLFAVLARYLQTHTEPPVPPIRLVALVCMVALATMLCVHGLPLLAWRVVQLQRRRGQRAKQAEHDLPLHWPDANTAPAADVATCDGKSGKLSRSSSSGGSSSRRSSLQGEGRPAEPAAAEAGDLERQARAGEQPTPHSPFAQQQPDSGASQAEDLGGAEAVHTPGADAEAAAPAALERRPTTMRPSLPLQRGLSKRFEQLEQHSPALYQALALGGLTVAVTAGTAGQIIAPGFVAAPIVQLVSLFQVIGIALVQGLLLRHAIPWPTWPAAVLMTGGAAMVIVPSIDSAASGSLGSARSWLGFGLAVMAMLAAVTFMVLMQATRHVGFNIWHTQYLFVTAVLITMLALSLPIEGTDWAASLAGWSPIDWIVLALLGSVVYVGSNFIMQIAVLRLGAPVVAMFVGLRLVATVVQSKIVLGTSTIQTKVQAGGIAVVVIAVTGYMWWQWRSTVVTAKPAEVEEEEPEPGSAVAGGAAAP